MNRSEERSDRLSLPRLTFFTHFTLSIHAVGGSERSERFTFPSGRLRRVKREGVNDRRAGSVPRRRPAEASEETERRSHEGRNDTTGGRTE